MRTHHLALITAIALSNSLVAAPQNTPVSRQPLPRTADGKPNLKGIWQASSTAAADLQDHAAAYNMLAGGRLSPAATIPYQPWAAAKKAENFQNRQKADPLATMLPAGRPADHVSGFSVSDLPDAAGRRHGLRVVAGLSPDLHGRQHRTPPTSIPGWAIRAAAGKATRWWWTSANYNDKTWFDMAGDFHSDALHVVERYRMTDPDTIQYEATIEDSKVFTKPWTISIPLQRRTDRDRLFEYVCQAEAEEANGAFTREERTWYPGSGTPPPPMAMAAARACLRLREPWRTFAGRLTASRTCRAFTIPTPEARTRDWRNARRRRHAGRTRRHRRSAGREASHAAVGRGGKGQPEPDRTRLRRSDGALFPGRCSAIDVCPGGVSHHSNAGLHRLSARAHVVAHCAAGWTRAPSRHHPFVAGRFRGALGRRHAGGRYDQLQRQDLAERRRRDCELRRARGGTIHPGGSRHASTTRRPSPIRWCIRGRGRSPFR